MSAPPPGSVPTVSGPCGCRGRSGRTWCWHRSSATSFTVIGDTSKFVPAGDARLEVFPVAQGADLIVKGAGETVTITGWSATTPTVDGTPLDHDARTGVWTLAVDVPSRGWARVEVRTAAGLTCAAAPSRCIHARQRGRARVRP